MARTNSTSGLISAGVGNGLGPMSERLTGFAFGTGQGLLAGGLDNRLPPSDVRTVDASTDLARQAGVGRLELGAASADDEGAGWDDVRSADWPSAGAAFLIVHWSALANTSAAVSDRAGLVTPPAEPLEMLSKLELLSDDNCLSDWAAISC